MEIDFNKDVCIIRMTECKITLKEFLSYPQKKKNYSYEYDSVFYEFFVLFCFSL